MIFILVYRLDIILNRNIKISKFILKHKENAKYVPFSYS
jgi:hypothetical protein